ncbi:MAG: hypothetical protein WD176_05310 [Pirellulales bacterium]
MSTEYDRLTAALAGGGVDAVLERLAVELREAKKYRELFQARQMQVRRRLGLPVIGRGGLGETPEPLRTQLEDGYVEACREVGRLFLAEGRLRDAWPYLNVAGDRDVVRQAMTEVGPEDPRAGDVIELALYEGVWPLGGLELVLKSRGTCNTITTMEGVLGALSKEDQAGAAALLVRHLHAELMANVKADIARQGGAPPVETTLEGLLADRDWLLADDAYHIDTTHLSATLRFARLTTAADDLRLALDLAEYGRRLSSRYHFDAEEPFVEFYPSTRLYLRALLAHATTTSAGQGGQPAGAIDEAANYFRGRVERLNVDEQGTSAVEHYLALLARVGREELAMTEAVRLIPVGSSTVGIAPGLMELADRSGRYDRLTEICRERGDLIGFAAGLVELESQRTR